MVKVKESLIGQKFGRLTVIEQAEDYISPKGEKKAQWLCECDCKEKNRIITVGNLLKGKHTQSCGCLAKEIRVLNGKNNKKYNTYDLSGGYGIGYDCNGKEFWFDLEDYELIKDYRWCFDSDGYVVSSYRKNGKIHHIRLHRLVMGNPNDIYEIDHKHGYNSKYDNRKSNLIIATKSQNQMNTKIRSNNTSGVTGVCWSKKDGKWCAYINANKQNIYLGSFIKFENAVKARKEAEEKYFGEFSYDNSMKNSDTSEVDIEELKVDIESEQGGDV